MAGLLAYVEMGGPVKLAPVKEALKLFLKEAGQVHPLQNVSIRMHFPFLQM